MRITEIQTLISPARVAPSAKTIKNQKNTKKASKTKKILDIFEINKRKKIVVALVATQAGPNRARKLT
jgi:hypothetical protein